MILLFNILFIWIMVLIPILLWAYIFSYLDNSNLNAKRFIVWIISWSASVLPVLYLQDIMKFLNLERFDIIKLTSIWNYSYFDIFLSVNITIIFLSIFMYIVWSIYIEWWKIVNSIYVKNTITILLFSILFVILLYFSENISILNEKIEKPIEIWKYIFNTLGLVSLYYVIVWLLEETSKHFWFIPSSLKSSESIKKWVTYWTFIALGFWFIENILYTFNIHSNNWYTSELFTTLFFRSLFSLFVHIFCSTIVLNNFIKAYLKYKENKIDLYRYSKALFVWITYSIIIHAIYDISLTLDFTLIVFIYFFIWYLYVTKIFYQEI